MPGRSAFRGPETNAFANRFTLFDMEDDSFVFGRRDDDDDQSAQDAFAAAYRKHQDVFRMKFEKKKVLIEFKIAAFIIEIGEKIAEKTGNFEPLKLGLERMDAVEARLLELDERFPDLFPDAFLERVRAEISDATETLTEANAFREAPDFDGSHIDWLIGQNVETYETVRDMGFLAEGNVDYFNLNAGAGQALIGENTEFTGNNNVTASLQAASADGGTITLGFELRNFGPGTPTDGQDLVASWWDMFEAGEIENDDLVAFVRAQAANGVVQAQTLASFMDILLANGGGAEAIHFRPGYEFDADFNGYTPTEYIKLFKFMATLLKDEDAGLGLDNVKMVWQSQSGAERSPNPIYDEANGADAPITEQDVFDHLDLWYPGDDYVDLVGMSFFQTAESAANWMFADGTANDGLAVMDDFDLYLQAFANYAAAHGKGLDISEASPAGAYLDRDHFNEIVAERLAEDPEANVRFLEEGELAYAKFHTDDDPDNFIPGGLRPDVFFDEDQPNFFVSTTAQIWNDYFVPFFQYVERNADLVDSINMISYNWDEVPLFESLATDADPNVPLQVNFGSANWFDNPELADLINDYVTDVFG